MNLTNIDKPLGLGERHIFFKIAKLLKTVAAKDTDRMVTEKQNRKHERLLLFKHIQEAGFFFFHPGRQEEMALIYQDP